MRRVFVPLNDPEIADLISTAVLRRHLETMERLGIDHVAIYARYLLEARCALSASIIPRCTST